MGRRNTPYGYRIENGKAVLCEEEVKQIREVYTGYLSGLSYVGAAKKAGFDMKHGAVKNMLQNMHYLGDDFYPAIIDRQTFDAAEKERCRRSKALGRDGKKKREGKGGKIPVRFRKGVCEKDLEDPYEQAQYLYSLLERED